MFKKRDDQQAAEKAALLKSGWVPQLITPLIEFASKRGLAVPSRDYETVLDGYAVESNNFDIERKGYGSIRLRVGERATEVDIPVVVYFVHEDDRGYQDFHPQITDCDVLGGAEQTRPFGKAILNGLYISAGVGKEDLLPIFEWYLYLRRREWAAVKEVFELSDSRYLPRVGIRVGLPSNITNDSIVNDSMNSRLLVYRVWVDTVKVYSAERLNQNEAFKFDQSGT